MCFASVALPLIAAGVSAAGAQAQASGQANQLAHNAAVARINRDTARQQGAAEADRIAQKYRGVAGQQTAAYGRAGVLPTSGSAAIVGAETARNAWLDGSTAIWNRETEATGFENKAQDLDAQAKNTRKAGNIAAASTFLTGLGRINMGGSGAGSPLQVNG